MVQGTFFENRRLKKAMANFLYELDASYFVTANFNRDTNYAAARRTLSAWHARIDKALLGGSWSRKARNERTFFIACVGHIDSNLHWHLILRLGDGAERQRFEAVAAESWVKLVLGGSMKVDWLATDLDRLKTARYTVEELWQQRAIESFVLSTEFGN